MKVGFTGTRHGTADAQEAAVKTGLGRPFHHGDCAGADEEGDGLAHGAGTVLGPNGNGLICYNGGMRPNPLKRIATFVAAVTLLTLATLGGGALGRACEDESDRVVGAVMDAAGVDGDPDLNWTDVAEDLAE